MNGKASKPITSFQATAIGLFVFTTAILVIGIAQGFIRPTKPQQEPYQITVPAGTPQITPSQQAKTTPQATATK